MFTRRVARVIDSNKAHGTLLLLLSLGCVLVVGLHFRHKGDVPVSIFPTGFAGMLLDLVMIFVFQTIFVLLSFICGLLVGAQYPLACRLRLEQGEKPSSTTGLLYGLDSFGGWAGGVTGGLL